MKHEAKYIVRRVIVALVIILIMGLARKASAQAYDFQIAGNYFSQHTYSNSAEITIINPGASAVTLAANSQATLNATNAPGTPAIPGAVHFYTTVKTKTGAAVSIPAGGSYLAWVQMEVGSSSGYHNATYYYFQLSSLKLTLNNISTTRNLNAPIVAKSRFFNGDPKAITPNPAQFGQMYLSDPPARVEIRVQADQAAAGGTDTRSFSIGSGPVTPTILVQGFNTIVDGYNPTAYTVGDLVTVYQSGIVIGQAPITKDQWGNINMTVQATGLLVTAKTTVVAPIYMSGDFKLEYQGREQLPMLFSFPQGGTFEHIVDDPFNYAPGIEIRVFMMTDPAEGPGEWVRVGTSSLVKDALGGWNITVPLNGTGDTTPGPNQSNFSLDVLSYDPGTQSITLEINGETIVASPSTLTGVAGSGNRTAFSVQLDNSDGRYSGKPYSWKITGMLDGAPVAGKTIANGTTPLPVSIPGDLNETENGFLIADVATVGDPAAPPVPPENPYDPETPLDPQNPRYEQQLQQREAYQAQRKAIADEGMLNDLTQSPDEGEARDLAKRIADSTKGLADAVQEMSDSAAPPPVASPGTIGSSPTLTITLPYFAPFTIDSRNYGDIGPMLRTVLLGCLAFTTVIAGTKIVTAAFAA